MISKLIITAALSALLPFAYGQSLLASCSNFALGGPGLTEFEFTAQCKTSAGTVVPVSWDLTFDCVAFRENAFKLACPFPNGVAENVATNCINCSVSQQAILTCECFSAQSGFLTLNLGSNSCLEYFPSTGSLVCNEID